MKETEPLEMSVPIVVARDPLALLNVVDAEEVEQKTNYYAI